MEPYRCPLHGKSGGKPKWWQGEYLHVCVMHVCTSGKPIGFVLMIARSFRCPPARLIASHRYVLPTSPPTSAGPREAVPRIPDTGHPGRGGMRPLQGRLWWRGRRGRFVGERLREGPHVAAVPAVRCRGRPTFAGQAYGVLREAQETHEGAIKVQSLCSFRWEWEGQCPPETTCSQVGACIPLAF